MEWLPVGLKLSGKRILVVGGGAVALRKIRLLLRCRARVMMVSPDARPELRRLAAARKIVWKKRPYAADVTKSGSGGGLVFVCTDSDETNSRIAREAEEAGLWVNRADCPEGSTAHLPAIAQLGHLTVAIFSGGRSPAYVKYLRKRIEKILGPTVGVELGLLAEIRKTLQEKVPSQARRKRILTRLIEDRSLETIAGEPKRRREAALRERLEDRL